MRAAVHVSRIAAAAALALAAAACSGGGGTGSGGGSAEAGVVRAYWGDPQNPLEPANTNEVQGGKVLDMVFRGLKIYDPRTGAARNEVAQSVTTTDQQTFTVRLRPGWRFSNGEPVTARSFVDAWNYGALVTNKQLNSSFFGYIQGYDKVHPASGGPTAKTMSGLTVVDDLTFTVALSQKFSLFPDTLGYAAYYPLPRTFFTDHAAWLRKPVGNGPYTVASYTKGSRMELRRSASFSGTDKARNGGVDLIVYTDANTAYTDLQAGNLDVIDIIPAAQLANAQSDLSGRFINQPAGIIQTISFPMYQPAWNTPGAQKVRLGLSMAVNRAQITQKIFHGSRTPATDWTSPVLGTRGGWSATLCGQACTYDPARAKTLVQQGGGLPGGRMTISYNADGDHKTWVDAVCNSINTALGDDRACTGNPIGTFADFRSQVTDKKMTSAFRTGWQMDYPLIQDFLEPLYATGGSSNDSHFSNARFDTLVNQANAASTPAAAVSTFQDAERILAVQMPAIPLWYQNAVGGYSDRVSDVRLNPFSVPVYNQITVKG
ncbi:ABC transporter substrate-binding protein [Streptacidiphilus sp. ASG 303]|uniref:peptide ABC transporter substrate-binding protein n=1 Tax=Streptacidiphilus sp. ASG 303 TaxID=2896847 RepID=UPI001E3DD7BF|nr:ABC transporter substrate-binding protein [Streptacidiphilus sp. ASG 303]MCD0486453.1 ABC transporter substrate-binding protein [Streptacidiphilus sp. ASG 303]